jgi:hypothetical protein
LVVARVGGVELVGLLDIRGAPALRDGVVPLFAAASRDDLQHGVLK